MHDGLLVVSGASGSDSLTNETATAGAGSFTAVREWAFVRFITAGAFGASTSKRRGVLDGTVTYPVGATVAGPFTVIQVGAGVTVEAFRAAPPNAT